MTWEKWIIALVPIPAFYLIYYRYFTFRPEYLKHLESFLSGIAFAFILILLSPLMFSLYPTTNPLVVGFLKAALPEKIGACIILVLLFRYFPNFSVMEATLTAALFGIGFSAVENLFYSFTFGYSVIILRILFSAPMHLTTCGILGYYLGMRAMSETGHFRLQFLAKGIVASITLHGLFDTILLAGGYVSYLAPPMLILMVVILEVMMAKSQTIPPRAIIRAMNLRFEEWILLERQPRFERWILQSMGTRTTPEVHFFLWRPGAIRFLLVIGLLAVAIVCLAYREEIVHQFDFQLRNVEQIILFGSFPVSISLIIILVGAINPVFFTTSVIRIPVISDVVTTGSDGFEETLVTYDITSENCFLRTSEPFGIGTVHPFRFEYSTHHSGDILGEVVWENHTNPRISTGSIIRLTGRSTGFFLRFMARYYLFRMKKGIIFNLKLPGFEATRKLFMRPITTMQEDRIYKAGSIVFHEQDRGSEFYLLKKGRIRFYKTTEHGDTIVMDTIEDQQIFGEMAVIGNVTRATTAVCETECVIATADRENLTALIKSNTDFALSLIETLAHRVQNSEMILLDTIKTLEKSLKNKDRLYRCAVLLTLAVMAGDAVDDSLKRDVLDAVSRAATDTGVHELIRLAESVSSGTRIVSRDEIRILLENL
ncbi:MAG: cyclic nucleotide-binding domain-containing protein [Spirochaetes bacterium]|nr:cyclic nucleotide-binding domain-containing protein [Spirochaetota bacterium]